MVTVTGSKGANGTTGSSPKPGGNGGDAVYTYTGDGTVTVTVTGGAGGRAGGNTAAGKGGDADGLVQGRTLTALSPKGDVIVTVTGGTGGAPLSSAAMVGAGGNSTAEITGNTFDTSTGLLSLNWTATAHAGTGGSGTINGPFGSSTVYGKNGNAAASVVDNSLDYSGTGTGATLVMEAVSTGFLGPNSQTALNGTGQSAVTGNSISGNLGSVTLESDSNGSLGTAILSNNTTDLTLADGQVLLTMNASSMTMDDNAITAGGENVTVTFTSAGGSSVPAVEFSGNSFHGDGQNTLDFFNSFNNTTGGASVTIDLAAGTFVVNGKANSISGFANVSLNTPTSNGNGSFSNNGFSVGTLYGNSQDNILEGGATNVNAHNYLDGRGGNDTLIGSFLSAIPDILIGGAGDDIVSNGIAAFHGEVWQYTFSGNTVDGPDGHDTLQNITQLRFMGVTQVSDFDGDGYSDLLFGTVSGAVHIDLMNGPTVQSGADVDVATGAHIAVVGSGDFDGDGRSDVLRQNSGNGRLYVSIMDGTQQIQTLAINPPTGGADWAVKAIADFDWGQKQDDGGADGTSDILLQNKTTGGVQIDLMSGGGVASTATVASPAGTSWVVAAAGDFNGDGFADILWQNTTTNQIAIDLMQDTSVTQQVVLAGAGPKVRVIATGDFNGDGNSDILWQNPSNGNVAIWFMDGGTVTSKAAIAQPPGSGWVVKGAEDINRDGKSDILWQNAAGQVYVSLMSGGTALSGSGLVTTPGAGWNLIATGGPSGG